MQKFVIDAGRNILLLFGEAIEFLRMPSPPKDIFIDANMARIVGRFNNALRLRKLDDDLFNALAAVPSCGSNDSVFSAKALTLEVSSTLNTIFLRERDLHRVGPVVAVYKERVVVEEEFRLLNFFGSDRAAKRKAPNKVYINLNVHDLAFDAIVPQSAQQIGQLSQLDPPALNGQSAQLTSITLPPGHALIVPVEFVPHRFRSAGEVLVLHGYFAA